VSALGSTSRLLAALLAGGVLAATPAIARADVATEGLWYFDALHVQDAHDAGFTGEGVTIAVLDTPINLDLPTLRGADIELGQQPDCYADGAPVPVESTDIAEAVHGTNVVALLVGSGAGEGGSVSVKGVAPGATVLYYRVGRGTDLACDDAQGVDGEGTGIGQAIHSAIDAGADIISISLGFGAGSGVREAVARGLGEGVLFVTALENQDGSLMFVQWSQFLNGGVSVQAIDSSASVQTHEVGMLGERVPNTDRDVDVAAPGVGILNQGTAEEGWAGQILGNGTSFATPIVAGFLAVTAQKYPDATSNQLIQSLIHNTGVDDHELTYDSAQLYGYGVVSLTHLLRVDPTTYPDVNPLLEPDGEPNAEEIAAALAEATPQPTTPPTEGTPSWLPVLIGIGVGGAVLVVAVALLIAVLLRRRRT
jgi:subtilisin family serine protease